MFRKNNAKNNNFAFVDSQNLNLGIRSQGWKVDHRSIRLYLKYKFNVNKAYMFRLTPVFTKYITNAEQAMASSKILAS